jgi:serine/threonine protein kinase
MPTHATLQGQTLGQYQLKEVLAEGAMSTVYRAFQSLMRRDVAVKVLASNLSVQPGFAERFEQDMQKVSALEHIYIVPVYDFATTEQGSYIVMRLLTGGSLADRMHDTDGKPRLPSLREVDALVRQLAGALDFAHQKGIVHSDLKPHNILFDEHNNPYLTDFGVARLVRAMPSAQTANGVVLGTPAYMPPEQWRGETLTAAADQYALAVILYQVVCGKPPFQSYTPFAVMAQHLNEAPPPLHQQRPNLPEALSDVFTRALAKNPADRFESLTKFSRALEKAVKEITDEPTDFFLLPQKIQSPARHIFLSYSRADSDLMARVRDELSSSGFKVWTDGNLTPGTPSWKDGIEQAIEGAGCVVVILSPDSKQSEWVKRELDYALAYGLPIFPVLARGDERSAVPFALISTQRVDIREQYAQGIQNLMNAIRQQVKM